MNWMAPFAITIRDRNEPNPEVKSFDNVMVEDHHNIQTHDITIDTLVCVTSHLWICRASSSIQSETL